MTGKCSLRGGQAAESFDLYASAEIFDPATGTWTQTGSLNYNRSQHTATLLPDGRVLVVGGGTGTGTTEFYDPTTGRWTQIGPLNYQLYTHTATLLDYGAVFITGGSEEVSITSDYAVYTRTELFYPGP